VPCGDGHAQNAYGLPVFLLTPLRQMRAPCLHTGAAVPDASDTGVGGNETGGVVLVVEPVVDKGATLYAAPSILLVATI
jgi:hypothetical protein